MRFVFSVLVALLCSCVQALPPPDVSKYKIFVATPPYMVKTSNGEQRIQLGMYGTKTDKPRVFDFVAPLMYPVTGTMNAMTWQLPANTDIGFVNVSDLNMIPNFVKGAPDRLTLEQGVLRVSYIANDSPSNEKIRVMLNTWPISNDKEFVIDLSFRLGQVDSFGYFLSNSYWISPHGQSPVLLWQMKSEPSRPSMSMVYDADPLNIGKFKLDFNQRVTDSYDPHWIASIGGLEYGQYVDVMMRLNLTDNPTGRGYWEIWVNGQNIGKYEGQTLIANLPPHRWAFGQYMYRENYAKPADRETFWRRARMLVPK